jgi:hypothetical protein
LADKACTHKENNNAMQVWLLEPASAGFTANCNSCNRTNASANDAISFSRPLYRASSAPSQTHSLC